MREKIGNYTRSNLKQGLRLIIGEMSGITSENSTWGRVGLYIL